MSFDEESVESIEIENTSTTSTSHNNDDNNINFNNNMNNSSISSSSSRDSNSSSSSSNNVNNNNVDIIQIVDGNVHRNVRQRVVMTPMDLNLITSRIFLRMKEVNIDNLSDEEEILKMNLNRNYIDVQLLRLITPSKDQKANIYSRQKKQQSRCSFQSIISMSNPFFKK